MLCRRCRRRLQFRAAQYASRSFLPCGRQPLPIFALSLPHNPRNIPHRAVALLNYPSRQIDKKNFVHFIYLKKKNFLEL